jgi:SNF2 family DNA or RNA helicase
VKVYGTLRHVGPAPDALHLLSLGPARPDVRPVWEVEATPDVVIRLKRLFPRAEKHRRGSITLRDTPEIGRDLAWALDRWPLDMSDADRCHLRARARQHEQMEENVHEVLHGGGLAWREGFIEPARTGRDYQLVAADLALRTGGLLLADELGLGKTMSGLLVLREPAALPALVVCPAHLPEQWVSEIARTFPLLRTHIIRTLAVYEPRQRRELRGHDPDVLITTYTKLRGWADHLAGKVRTVIFDEAQELRRAESEKYIAAGQVADGADFVVGLTATPVYNYGGEIHTIMEVLAPDALGDRGEFGREWGGGSSASGKLKVADPAALGTYLRDQGLMLRRTRKDVARELPAVVRVPHVVEADENVLTALAGDALALAELIVARETPREELFRASGDFDWRMRHATGVAKAPYVAEFVRLLLDAEERIVLFGWHRQVYDIWRSKLADFEPVFYTGQESPAQKHRSRDAFLAGDSRVLVMSLRAGLGLDGLQDRAHVAVFGELDWSPGMHEQCVGRLHRDGQAEPVVAYFLVSDHGADPVMAEVLNLKRMQSEPLHDPHAEPFAQAEGTDDRVRRLAADVLRKSGRPAGMAVESAA